jgi:hypothetical protein
VFNTGQQIYVHERIAMRLLKLRCTEMGAFAGSCTLQANYSTRPDLRNLGSSSAHRHTKDATTRSLWPDPVRFTTRALTPAKAEHRLLPK